MYQILEQIENEILIVWKSCTMVGGDIILIF